MKRTQLLKLLAITMLMATVVVSCTEQFTGQDALLLQSSFDREQVLLEDSIRRVQADEEFQYELLRDSLQRAGGVINYAVTVISAANSGTTSGRGEVAAGATVTVSQHGVSTTVTTNAAGQAVFEDMRVGNAAVTVSATDHTTAAATVDLTPIEATEGDATIDYSKIVRNAATQIPLFPTAGEGAATIEGVVYGETDLTNDSPELIEGYSVTAYINVDNLDSDYFDPDGATNADAAGRIVQITYTDVAQTVQTASDGSYSITVPASGEGLPISIATSDFVSDVSYHEIVAENTLGVGTYRHVFSPNNTTSTDIEQVPAVFIEIDAPTGSEETGSGASASAVVDDEGNMVALRIDDAGRGYTQAPEVVIDGIGNEGFGAAGSVTITNGRITSASLTAAGQDYDPNNTDVELQFTGKEPTVNANVEFSLNDMMGEGWSLRDDVNYGSLPVGSFNGGILVNSGSGFVTQPTSTTLTNATGTGATATAEALIYVDELDVTAVGKGYTATPLATFAGGTPSDDENPDEAIAAVELAYGPLLNTITVGSYGWEEGPFTNDKSSEPSVSVDDVNGNSYNTSSSADIDVTWSSTGVLPEGTTLQINNAGSGYIDGEVDVTFSGAGFGGTQPAVKVETNGDGITSIEVLETTDGWDQEQTITVTVSGAGTLADVELAANSVEYPVASVTVNTGGSYQFNTLTADEIDDLLDGNNPYGGGIEENDMRLYVNSSTDDFLYEADLEFNRCVERVVLYESGEYFEGPTSLTIDAPASGTGVTATVDFTLDGYIVDIVINAGGSGYTPEDTEITIAGGNDDVEVDMTPFEDDLDAWEELAVDPLLVGFTVEDGGQGYTADPNVMVTVPGDGAYGSQSYGIATATSDGDAITSVDFAGAIASLEYEFNDLGDLDYSGIEVSIMTWKDAGALEAEFATGAVVAINVTNGGENYDAANPPTIRIESPDGIGSTATAVAVVVDGRVVRIDLTDGGSGYDPDNAPSVEFIEPDGAPVTAKAVAFIDEKTGAITSVSLRSPTDDCLDPSYYSSSYSTPSTSGEGYIVAPGATATASVAGEGSGAVLEVEINDEGEVTSVTVVDGGSGYFGGNMSENYTSTPGNDVDVSYYTVTNQSSNNVVSGKTHIRDINLGTGREFDPSYDN